MVAAAFLILLAIGALLIPDLRAEPGTWVVSSVLIGLAALLLTIGRSSSKAIQTARQVKYSGWWGYTSHDGSGERDIREKRGE
jgi:hypothetical protein